MGMAGECTPDHEVVRDRSELAATLGGVGGRQGLVAVVGDDAGAWLGTHGPVKEHADEIGVVSLGEQLRSTTAGTANAGSTAPIPDVVGVPDADNLAQVGRTVMDFIERYTEQGVDPVVVVDAVEELVDAVGLEATFRVLHLLSARAEMADGRMVTVIPDSLQADQAETLAALAD